MMSCIALTLIFLYAYSNWSVPVRYPVYGTVVLNCGRRGFGRIRQGVNTEAGNRSSSGDSLNRRRKQATLMPLKQDRVWRAGKLQRRVAEAARHMAERETARVPWAQLQEAREKFVAWEAFAFWVRAIEDAEGNIPRWLARAIEKRCQGFPHYVAQRDRHHKDGQPFLWSHLEDWIHERIFGKPWREGWM